jgi:serine/threonine protein kinase
MQENRWRKIEAVFNEAAVLPVDEREGFVRQKCANDEEFYREVWKLVKGDILEDDFLQQPAFTLGAQVMESDFSALLEKTEFASYKLQKFLGRGGTGAVFLAKDKRLKRLVALKLLPQSSVKINESILRFEQEALAASAVSHTNVAHIYEIGDADKHHFIAMEYVKGETLREFLKRQNLDFVSALNIALQIAQGLAAAHTVGVIHRDIKPENIMIRQDGLVKVVDFGLAKLTESQYAVFNQDSYETQLDKIRTEPGILMGTATYMSPEQARGQEIDTRTDIWSWGVVFYEILAGKQPFNGATNSDIIAEILKSEPPLLQTYLPNSVSLILRRALSKDKNHRYKAMSEVIGELQTLLRQVEHDGILHLNLPLNENTRIQNATSQQELQLVTPLDNRLPDTFQKSNHADDKKGILVTSKEIGNTNWKSTFSWKSEVRGLTKIASRSPFFVGAGGLLVIILVLVIYGLINRNFEQHKNTIVHSRITQLTQDGRVKDVAISGDARLLAYVPIDSEKQSLWIRDLENSGERQLLPPDSSKYWGMRFTPDGQSLLYIVTQPNSSINVLYVISVSGGLSTKIVTNIAEPPAISPDGREIAFKRNNPEKHYDGLFIANIDGSAEREIASRQFPDTFSSSSASWSPDEKLIVTGVGRNNETESAVMAIPVDGGTAIELTPWRWIVVEGIAWEGNGQGLVFSAREKDSKILRLWRLSYPDGQIQSLTDNENSYEEVTLARAENTLVTMHTYEVSDIWFIGSSGMPRRLTTQGNEAADGLATISSGRIIYTRGEYEQSFIWSMNMDGTDRKPLIENNGFLPSTSRDGRFIAYVSTKSGTHHIWLMEADGRNNKQWTNGNGENYPSLTSDGNWIVYTLLEKERNTIWKIPTSGGQPIQLTSDGFTIKPQVSPDGTMIACTYRKDTTSEWKIVVLPFSGGLPLKTFELPNPRYQMIRWTSDSKALLYVDKRGGAQNLWRQPLDESAPSQITNFTEDQILHHDWLSAGTELVLSRGGRRRDIAIIKNYK